MVILYSILGVCVYSRVFLKFLDSHLSEFLLVLLLTFLGLLVGVPYYPLEEIGELPESVLGKKKMGWDATFLCHAHKNGGKDCLRSIDLLGFAETVLEESVENRLLYVGK